MTNLERRLGKLEAQLIDSSGLVPHTPRWLEYWRNWLERSANDPTFHPRDLMPVEAARAIIAGGAPDDEYARYQARHANK
jgi:hypothetical protein